MSSNILVCALSGQSPIEDPVVTPTGQICSKKLLLQKLIETNYMNPFTATSSDTTNTAMPLDESQLIEIQTDITGSTSYTNATIIPPAPPKPTNSNSIPSILNTLSSEYDALVLELYDTRKALEETRKELSVALYQNDAAVRVIARVVLERDVARRELANALVSPAPAPAPAGNSGKRKRDENESVDNESSSSSSSAKKMNIVEQENNNINDKIPMEHSKKLQEKWNELCKSRKAKTKAGPNYATLDDITKYTCSGKRYHKSNNKGIVSLTSSATAGTADEPLLVSVGKSDKQLIWYNPIQHKIQKSTILKNCLLNSECLSTYNNITAVVTEDYILHIYSNGENEEIGSSGSLVLDNEDAVVGIEVHPTCEHVFVSTESGKTHIIHIKEEGDGDNTVIALESIAVLQCLNDGAADEGVKCTCMGIHPDGLIMALGRNDGKIILWDLKTEKLASTLEGSSESNAPIKTMSFSEKGYHVAVSTEDSIIAVWDLRKQKIAASIKTNDDEKEDNSVFASALSFDAIGKHLAYGCSNGQVVITTVKEWEKKHVLDKEKKKGSGGLVSGIVWGVDAKSVVTCREDDRTLKFWHGP